MTTSLTATTSSQVAKALTAERRATGAVTFGIVLTFVVVVSETHAEAAVTAARAASTAHPCRVVAVVPGDPDAPARLDADVSVGGESGPGEAVVLRLSGELIGHADAVVLPLLAPDTPVVTWWAGPPPAYPAGEPLGMLASRRITDTYLAADPRESLRRRARQYQPGDTDLAWTRDTLWRSVVAAIVDALADPVVSATVTTEHGNPSAALIASWLMTRLDIPIVMVDGPGPAITAIALTVGAPDGPYEVRLSRPDGGGALLAQPGHPDRQLPLPIRSLPDLLAEELSRLDPDEPYADALAAVTSVPDGSPDGAPVTAAGARAIAGAGA